ncbi:hypothetical protein JW710_01750 [Candidatus Dojkabacteria bacterium]|nr:hypothetical protein [Candidatus Dojkabacteria bacterium]
MKKRKESEEDQILIGGGKMTSWRLKIVVFVFLLFVPILACAPIPGFRSTDIPLPEETQTPKSEHIWVWVANSDYWIELEITSYDPFTVKSVDPLEDDIEIQEVTGNSWKVCLIGVKETPLFTATISDNVLILQASGENLIVYYSPMDDLAETGQRDTS